VQFLQAGELPELIVRAAFRTRGKVIFWLSLRARVLITLPLSIALRGQSDPEPLPR